VIHIEKSSFNPLAFTSGGNGTRINKRLVEKCKESYASVMTYIRTKLRFSLLRSTLADEALKANGVMFTS